ncbi:unnamed protein product [Heterobilharzia americana]|nr:unnamed protein product [Heterobilharzia americana]
MDKSLLFRILEPDESGQTAHFALEHHLVGRHSQLDAAITPTLVNSFDNRTNPTNRKRYLAVACQDRRLRIYNIVTARPVRCYRGSYTEDGFLVRCSIDPTGSIIATSGSDKQLNLFHLLTGDSIATLYGHSELSLGLRFLPNLRYLISVSADSCIFVWRLSSNLTQYLRERLTSSSSVSASSYIPKCSLGNSISYPQLDGIPLGTMTTTLRGEGGSVSGNGLYQVNRSEYPRLHSNPMKSSCSNLTAFHKHTYKQISSDDDREKTMNHCNNLLLYDNHNHGDEYSNDTTSEWNDSLGEYDKMENLDIDYDDDDDDNEFDSFPLDDLLSIDSSNLVIRRMKKSKSIVNENDSNSCVSALPAWARRKLSRRESVTIVPTSLPQVLTNEQDVVGSDSASQASVASGPILPIFSGQDSREILPGNPMSTSTTVSKLTSKLSKRNRLHGKKSVEDVSERSSVSTNDNNNVHSQLKTFNQMSRSEYKARECSNFNQTNEIEFNEQIHEKKTNWLTRAVSAPDTPRSYKKDAQNMDFRRTLTTAATTTTMTTTTTTTAMKIRKAVDNLSKKSNPTQGINRTSVQNRPKDLAIERFTPPHSCEVCTEDLLVNESVSGKDCTNPLPLFNRPKNRSNQRSYSATQLISTSSPIQKTPSSIDNEVVGIHTTQKRCFIDDTTANRASHCSHHHHHQNNHSKPLRASMDFISKASLISLSSSSSSYQDRENHFTGTRKYPSQSVMSIPNESRVNKEEVKRSSTRTSNPNLSHTKDESNSVKSAIESLHALRIALDLAVNRLAKLTCQNHNKTEEYSNDLRQIVTEELEWRFSRLRAMLGLSPICVEAPVARVLLADIVERLIPELKSASIILENPNVVNNQSDDLIKHINQCQLYKSMDLSETSMYDITERSNSTINHKTEDVDRTDNDDGEQPEDEVEDENCNLPTISLNNGQKEH